jgi:hypothetical protein
MIKFMYIILLLIGFSTANAEKMSCEEQCQNLQSQWGYEICLQSCSANSRSSVCTWEYPNCPTGYRCRGLQWGSDAPGHCEKL